MKFHFINVYCSIVAPKLEELKRRFEGNYQQKMR